MLKIIEYNPYRILGVYSNSSKKEQISNKGRLQAFLKVGNDIHFPLDLSEILGPIKRTESMVDDAYSKLALPEDRIKYSQFWFINKTKIDEIAFNHLLSGDIETAEEIWSKSETITSLQNRITLNLISNNWTESVNLAEKLYDYSADDYIKTIDESLLIKLSQEDLIQKFLNTLAEEIGTVVLLSHISNTAWKDYLIKNDAAPIVEQLNALVERAKSADYDDPYERLSAGNSLLANSMPLLEKLKSLLPVESDVQYQLIADKVALELMRCGIDYYNNVESNNSTAHDALILQQAAFDIAVGTMAREKCENNLSILKNNIENLPPQEVTEEDNKIKELIAEFCSKTVDIEDSIKLLQNAKPYISSIKSKLGKKNGYYLNISTQVVSNALYVIIAIINDSQGIEDHGFYKTYHTDTALLSSNLSQAQKAYRLMRRYDLEDDYNNFFKQNMRTLDSLSKKLGVNTYAQHIGCYGIVGFIIIAAFIGGFGSVYNGDSFIEGFATWAFGASFFSLFLWGIIKS